MATRRTISSLCNLLSLMRFSEKQGIRPTPVVQIESLDESTRSRLWNLLLTFFLDETLITYEYERHGQTKHSNLSRLFGQLWHNLFKLPLDTIPYKSWEAIKELRDRFFTAAWYEVFDILEFVPTVERKGVDPKVFRDKCNIVLSEQVSGYRFIGSEICSISDHSEIAEVESALKLTDPFGSVKTHLESALKHFSDRDNPDFRNSIKESISAVEAICQIITGEKTATLGAALKILKEHGNFSPALLDGFSKIYGYTSDKSGIRHAMSEQTTFSSVDAKFMLVACSTFTNYLLGKMSELGLSPAKIA